MPTYQQPKKVKPAVNTGQDLSEPRNVKMTVGNLNVKRAADKQRATKIRGTGAATKGTMARGPMA